MYIFTFFFRMFFFFFFFNRDDITGIHLNVFIGGLCKKNESVVLADYSYIDAHNHTQKK